MKKFAVTIYILGIMAVFLPQPVVAIELADPTSRTIPNLMTVPSTAMFILLGWGFINLLFSAGLLLQSKKKHQGFAIAAAILNGLNFLIALYGINYLGGVRNSKDLIVAYNLSLTVQRVAIGAGVVGILVLIAAILLKNKHTKKKITSSREPAWALFLQGLLMLVLSIGILLSITPMLNQLHAMLY